MRSMSLAVAILALAFGAAPVGAQETGLIYGRLLSTGSKAPIADAVVRLIEEGSERETVRRTDEAGRLNLVGVRPGLYRLEIDRSGFAAVEVVGIQVKRADRVRVNVEMTPWDEAPFKRQTIQFRRPLDNVEDATITTRVGQ
jgi:hypothetical protein